MSWHSLLIEKIIAGSLDCTARMIRAGARLNANDCNFGTPLHAATTMNHLDCVKLLLQAGIVIILWHSFFLFNKQHCLYSHVYLLLIFIYSKDLI